MPRPSADQKILESGAFLNLVAVQKGVRKVMGLVTNFTYNEDFNVTEAQVIGLYGPVSIDSQNYRCSLNFGTYLPPKPREEVTEPYLDGGQTTIFSLLKTRTEVSLDGKGSVIDQLDLLNLQSGVVVNSFAVVVISANGVQVNPNTYVTSNLQALAVERIL